jgi:hypothetical protein
MWKNGGDPGSTLAVLLEFEGRLHERSHRILKKARGGIETLKLLPIALGKFRLVIPGVDVGRATVDEEPDYMLGLAIEVWLAGLQGIIPQFDRRVAVLVQEGREGKGTQSTASLAQEFTPVPGVFKSIAVHQDYST